MKNRGGSAAAEAALQTEMTENDILIEQAYEALAGEDAGSDDGVVNKTAPSKWDKWKANFKRRGWILLFILPALIYVLIFCYGPMYGILIAFQDCKVVSDRIIGPDTVWNGFANFKNFFSDTSFGDYFLNTFLLCILGFIVGFPLPIIVALLLNSLRSKKAKKGLQILYYAPHFISLVVMVGMLKLFFGADGLFTGDSDLFIKPEAFRPLFIFSGNWQDFGWSAIIYLAALSGVDPALHEAAKVDGASRFRRIFSVDLPAIAPTIIMLMILSIGNLMSCGYEKVLLMQTSGNLSTSQIISTYVYNIGLKDDAGVGAAAGLFNSVINVVLLIIANFTSKKLANQSMW